MFLMDPKKLEEIKAGRFITRTAFEYGHVTGLDIIFVDKDKQEKTVATDVDIEFARYFVAKANGEEFQN